VVTVREVGRLGGAINGRAAVLLAAGLLGVAAYNQAKWRVDRALALRLHTDLAAPAPVPRRTPRVSILVAAWNEASFIERHIRSVLGLSYPNKEYILCAGGPDGTLEIARRFAGDGVVVLEQRPGEGKQRALQRAFERSTGDIVYLADADCLLADVSFHRLLEPLVDGTNAAASSSVLRPLPEQENSSFVSYQWSAQLYTCAHLPDYITGLLGMNCALRRETLEEAGAFSEHVATGTDYHLAKRLEEHGARVAHVRSGLAVTRYQESWARYARQQTRWLRNVSLHGVKFGALSEVASVLRTSFVGAAMLLLPVASLWLGPAARAAWLVALAHACLSKLRYHAFARIAAPDSVARPTPVLVAYALGDFAIWAAPLLQLVVPAWRARW
jgi:cellulose synthase/poly-beta-1,6-N-acetylglucosamine synthase-like glycosyltransferase